MLRHLHITNLALIDDLELSFERGLNVITGETGAGKSLLMQALGLAVGGRSAAELIRHEAQEARVEAVFTLEDARVAQLLEESGYSADEELLVRRVISQNGRGRVYLNGAVATVTVLRHLGEHGGEAVDLLFDGSEFVRLAAPRIETPHTHGTGCTYSAAIAALLARGETLVDAVCRAKDFISRAIAGAPGIGRGHGPVDHTA
jgi:hydroxymethylpyrimidine/phosphomethylpyrimidine kinase